MILHIGYYWRFTVASWVRLWLLVALAKQRYALVDLAYQACYSLLRCLHIAVGYSHHTCQFKTIVVCTQLCKLLLQRIHFGSLAVDSGLQSSIPFLQLFILKYHLPDTCSEKVD